MDKKLKKLHSLAVRVQQKAHAPYSKFYVGAALFDNKNRVHIGCNVENSSYGGTICAERGAIMAMVASGATNVKEILIVSPLKKASPPCGFCRQVLLEFAKNPHKVLVHLANKQRLIRTYTLAELLPHGFDADSLQDD